MLALAANSLCIGYARLHSYGSRLLILLSGIFLATYSFAANTTVTTVAELKSAVTAANNGSPDTTILLADGVYTLDGGLWISAANVTISGASGDRTLVTLQGDQMGPGSSVATLITVAADGFTLSDITLQKSGNHLIQIKGELNADAATIRNCILRDSYEQMIKASVDLSNVTIASDNGLVENCLFEFTAGIGPQFYVGGIDAHGARNWVVRGNEFRNIISPGGSIAEYAIHFWNGSADNLVEGNVIVNCDRGIGFGLDRFGNARGIIRNNFIYHSNNLGLFADVGIAVHNSPDTQIYNNTIFQEHDYPSAIEYRFAGSTNVLIANNLSNRSIAQLDGASGSVDANVIDASKDWFADPTTGNLHLNNHILGVVDSGIAVDGLTDDIDGDTRLSGEIDIGADELATVPVPNSPENLRVL